MGTDRNKEYILNTCSVWRESLIDVCRSVKKIGSMGDKGVNWESMKLDGMTCR